MKLIFARHGETDLGRENRFQGVIDSSINELGILQARRLGQFCKKRKIKKIYSSPFNRALETVKIVENYCEVKIEIKDVLKEICYGEWEGHSKLKLKGLPIWEERERNLFSFVHPGYYNGLRGESYENLYARIYPFFEMVKNENSPILVVSHIGIMRCVKKYFEKINEDEFRNINFSNHQVYEICDVKKHIATKIIDII